MTFSVYILYSLKLDRFYVGISKNLDKCMYHHNHGESTYTSIGIPWILIWITLKVTKYEAEELEQKLKNLSRVRKIRFMKKYSDGIVHLKTLDLIES